MQKSHSHIPLISSLTMNVVTVVMSMLLLLALNCQLTAATNAAADMLDIGTTLNDDAAAATATLNTRNTENSLGAMCPNMVHYVFEGAAPRDEAKAGVFQEYSYADPKFGEDVDMRECLEACCKMRENNTCHVVFIYKRKCYHVRCNSNEACLPKERAEVKDRLQMILVDTVRPAHMSDTDVKPSWLDVLKASDEVDSMLSLPATSPNGVGPSNFWKFHKNHYLNRNGAAPATYDDNDITVAEKRMKQMLFSDNLIDRNLAEFDSSMSEDASANLKYLTCDPEADDSGCPPREECIAFHSRPNGVCKCKHGYMRNHLRDCVLSREFDYPVLDNEDVTQQNQETMPELVAAASAVTTSKTSLNPKDNEQTAMPSQSETSKKLVVSVVSKEVRLPEKEVTLAAFTVPDEESSDTKYKYLWTLISQPKGPMNGTISDQSKSKVKLSNLSEGLYTFKVSVTAANNTYGEAMANVTVLPEKRINRIPQVVITPAEQTIRQPTTNAILDGSTSIDDDKIIGWHWEVISGPIGYQPKLPEVNTLQLTDLTSPGNYTFKLTVTDSDNVTNSTTAVITVLKGTDYPPVANAGDAVILYLPNNNVTLNGTASTDDHEIVAWEWTKDASDETKAADMQNTRTPYLQLSNLEEGIYTFVLKVTDGSGQSSTAKVHVFVKPPTNSPPVAAAGGNATINLPNNWVILNGSASTDDIRIVSYQWRQVSGPNAAIIENANAALANATKLTIGLYEFELSVSDENNNTSTDKMWAQIVQEKNAAPVANAGGDKSITLPISALYLNGSRSFDDLAVTKYLWTRDDTSLAAGLVVGNTDKEPVLILTNLVAGRYVFKLTVSDEQGLTSTDSVSVIVLPDENLMNLVQLTLPMGISTLTQSELDTIVQKLSLLLGDMKIHVRDLQFDPRTQASILEFYVETKPTDAEKPSAVNGLVIEQMLKEKLQRDASILAFVEIRSAVCQNKCSDHGVCNAATRACICEAFWMPSAAYFWGLDEANCSWSILYVFVTFVLLSSVFWVIACACRQSKKPRSRPKLQKYSLIGAQDEEAPNMPRSTSFTDSETESDVLFETRSRPANGILRMNGTSKNSSNSNSNNRQQGHSKYANTKLGRKIKT